MEKIYKVLKYFLYLISSNDAIWKKGTRFWFYILFYKSYQMENHRRYKSKHRVFSFFSNCWKYNKSYWFNLIFLYYYEHIITVKRKKWYLRSWEFS